MEYGGIDPGLSGAIAIISNGRVEIADTPTDMEIIGGKNRRVYDPAAMDELIALIPDYVKMCLEKVRPMPSFGASNFTFGMGLAYWVMALISNRVSWRTVSPQQWKKDMGLKGSDKNASRELACKLFPRDAHLFTRKKDHDRADATLIAEWLRRQEERKRWYRPLKLKKKRKK